MSLAWFLVALAVAASTAYAVFAALVAKKAHIAAKGSLAFRRAASALQGKARAEGGQTPASKAQIALADAGIGMGVGAWRATQAALALVLVAAGAIAGLPLAGAVLALCVVPAARAYRDARASKRNVFLEEQLSTLELQMAQASRAGISPAQSLAYAARHAQDPIAGHLEKMDQEMRLGGQSLAEAFERMAGRTDNEDARILATVVSVQQETGANLADTLEFLHETIAAKQRMRRTLRARVAEMRLTRTIVALTAPAIFCFCALCMEGYLDFYRTEPIGWAVLGATAVLEAVGLRILSRLSQAGIE